MGKLRASVHTALFLSLFVLFVRGGEARAELGRASMPTPQRRLASAERKVSRRVANLPAQEKTEITTRDTPEYREQSGTGIALFLGAGAGHMAVQPSAGMEEQEANLGGGLLQGRAGLSFYNRTASLDLTLGWMQSQISGAYVRTAPNVVSSSEAAVLTRAASVEFSPRLKFGEWFEAGPVAAALFGTNASFDQRTVESGSSPIFLGARASAVWETKELLFRVGAQAMTSLTIPERHATMFSGAFEIGIPLVRGKTLIREKEVHTVRNNFERETVEVELEVPVEVPVVKEVIKEVVKEIVTFSFDDQIVHFEFDHAQLLPESRDFLVRLGQYLASHSDRWGHIAIEGHTDQRGTDEYNQKLSAERVRSVMAALNSAGVGYDRITARAYGKTRPIDRGVADISHARNRRVEMSFSDVADARELRDAINRIRFETVKPATCVGVHCR